MIQDYTKFRELMETALSLNQYQNINCLILIQGLDGRFSEVVCSDFLDVFFAKYEWKAESVEEYFIKSQDDNYNKDITKQKTKRNFCFSPFTFYRSSVHRAKQVTVEKVEVLNNSKNGIKLSTLRGYPLNQAKKLIGSDYLTTLRKMINNEKLINFEIEDLIKQKYLYTVKKKNLKKFKRNPRIFEEYLFEDKY